MYKTLKKCAYFLLLFAVIISLAACDVTSVANYVSRSGASEISDLQMALLCDVVYNDVLDTYLANGQEIPADDAHSPIRVDYLEDMYDRNLPAQLSGFTVVDFDHGNFTGFRAAAFKKGDNLVVVYCGTEDGADVLAGIGNGIFDISSQDGQAKQFAEDNADKYPDCNIYVAGYSLGGRLAYLGTERIIDSGHKNRLVKARTFNGLGVTEMYDESDPNFSKVHRLEEKMGEYIVNHIVRGDDVSDGWIKNRWVLGDLSHIGECVYYDCTTPRDLGYIEFVFKYLNLTIHDLYTFIDAFSKDLIDSREVPENIDRLLNKPMPVEDFDITGSWKSVGDSGFGQAQPGTIVTFDGEHCNFYSPNDTYSIYQKGEKIVLECSSMIFSEKLKFDVVIKDDDNIEIKYGSTTTKLKRLHTSSGEGSGAATANFSIVGSWKSVGESGFGQAQPGAKVTFDGEHCNFYSPYDTYHFYEEDGKWILSCKNVLWQDVLMFTVEIIDNDNINIYYSPTNVTKLERIY